MGKCSFQSVRFYFELTTNSGIGTPMRYPRRYITKKKVLNVAKRRVSRNGFEGFFGTINHSYLLHSYVDLDVALAVQEPPSAVAAMVEGAADRV